MGCVVTGIGAGAAAGAEAVDVPEIGVSGRPHAWQYPNALAFSLPQDGQNMNPPYDFRISLDLYITEKFQWMAQKHVTGVQEFAGF